MLHVTGFPCLPLVLLCRFCAIIASCSAGAGHLAPAFDKAKAWTLEMHIAKAFLSKSWKGMLWRKVSGCSCKRKSHATQAHRTKKTDTVRQTSLCTDRPAFGEISEAEVATAGGSAVGSPAPYETASKLICPLTCML